MPTILEATDLNKAYHISVTPNLVLSGVSLTIEKGQFVALVAPSGEGKSTLLHILSGLDTPDSGKLVIDGHDVTAMNEHQRTVFRRNRIGFVFQFFNLVPTLSAAENVGLPLQISGGHREHEDIYSLMERLQLRGLQGHRPDEISGGEQQRIAIARALVTKPAIVIADEPTGNLDFVTGNEVLRVLKSVNQDGQTVIMATHSARAASIADRVVVLSQGRVVDDIAVGGQDTNALVQQLQRHGL